MSEEQLAEALGAAIKQMPDEPKQETKDVDTSEPEEKEEAQTEAPQLSKTQQEAFDSGWRPKADFEGDEENWVPAGTFLRLNTLQKELSDSKSHFQQELNKRDKDTESRLKVNNETHKQHLEFMRKQLEQKRDAAVEEGDVDAFKANQQQIDELAKQEHSIPPEQVQPQNPVAPEMQTWIDKNPWLNTDKPKAHFADAEYMGYIEKYPSATTTQALAHVDQKLAQHFPDLQPINPNRDKPSAGETTASRAGGVKKGGKMSWGDLTREELNFYDKAKSLYIDKKSGKPSKDRYLKAIADSRI